MTGILRCTWVALLVLALAACGKHKAQNGPDPLPNQKFTSTVSIAYKTGATPDTAGHFIRGAVLTFTLRVKNISSQSITLTFPDNRQPDFVVKKASDQTVMWRYTDSLLVIPGATTLTFAAGQTRTFTADWDMRDTTNTLVDPGDYVGIGEMWPSSPSPRPIKLSTDQEDFTIDLSG
jgi:hypothetical protein